MKTVLLPDGERVPALGQGTWTMGERPDERAAEIAALRAGVELGMTLIDTAEMYGDGATEALVAKALGDVRDELFLVTKAYPQNASRSRLAVACDASLCHYPFKSWNGQHRRSINLHGHSHGKLKPVPRQFDVGVDVRGYRPIALDALVRPPLELSAAVASTS